MNHTPRRHPLYCYSDPWANHGRPSSLHQALSEHRRHTQGTRTSPRLTVLLVFLQVRRLGLSGRGSRENRGSGLLRSQAHTRMDLIRVGTRLKRAENELELPRRALCTQISEQEDSARRVTTQRAPRFTHHFELRHLGELWGGLHHKLVVFLVVRVLRLGDHVGHGFTTPRPKRRETGFHWKVSPGHAPPSTPGAWNCVLSPAQVSPPAAPSPRALGRPGLPEHSSGC